MRLLTLSFVGFAFVGLAQADEPKLKLEGTYTIMSGERDGKELPADHFVGSLVVFTADKVVGSDKEKKQLFAASYTLDGQTITMKTILAGDAPKPATEAAPTPGMVEMKDDTLKIVYALPGGEAPKELKTGKNQQMFVLKKIKVDK